MLAFARKVNRSANGAERIDKTEVEPIPAKTVPVHPKRRQRTHNTVA
jgi:hypothetical protein